MNGLKISLLTTFKLIAAIVLFLVFLKIITHNKAI